MCRSEDCKQVFRMGCAMLCMCCGSPAERKHSAKSAPKSTKNVSGGTRKPPRAPTKQTTHFLVIFLAFPGLNHTMILTNFGSKIVEKWLQKNSQKFRLTQNQFFPRFFRFCASPGHDFNGFLGPKMASRRAVTTTFAGPFFSRIFAAFFGKKHKKQKSEKCCIHCAWR